MGSFAQGMDELPIHIRHQEFDGVRSNVYDSSPLGIHAMAELDHRAVIHPREK